MSEQEAPIKATPLEGVNPNYFFHDVIFQCSQMLVSNLMGNGCHLIAPSQGKGVQEALVYLFGA